MQDPPTSAAKGGSLSPHADDKPAPLFSSKRPDSPSKSDEAIPTELELIEATEAPLADQPPGEESEQAYPAYELDVDGSPVVGDVLKINFVDHHVVPTILVSFLTSSY
jgi:SIT4-associating protein SAP185/190